MILDLRVASLPEIAAQYRAPESSWVRANMVVSQDNQFVGENDTSRDLTSSEDLSLLLLLRALSDVLLVGANTARQERYRQPKKHNEFAFLKRATPTLAVVSSSLNFDLASPLFHGGEHKTIIINAGNNEPTDELTEVATVVPVSSGINFGNRIIAALAHLGLDSVTCEGGPGLLEQLLAADIVDEYDLTVSPVVVGRETPHPSVLPDETDWETVAIAQAGNFRFKRCLRKRT